ncbi:hypothetical protein NQ315_011623 [Exocentrus adspersus]|uniref:BZIP domain-containing protein n=1 Tax=Exocentrus adspersus TaxID=1586481 RepID=A0AAV8VVJ3_9CUCU|nr:hypothetical protein NQ315_011623 [Exocentrus adspersus]
MASSNKRVKYEYAYDDRSEVSSTEEDSYDDSEYTPNKHSIKRSSSRTSRKPKCFTKNALLARENRLKKKIYITNLENDVASLRNENKKLSKIVDNQSYLITDLKKQLRYFKSVVANSSDISKLIRSIHQNTGMCVSSSLDKKLSLKNVCVPKLEIPIARKTAHPWDEEPSYPSYPTPESKDLCPSLGLKEEEWDNIASDVKFEFPIDFTEDKLLDAFSDNFLEAKPIDALGEHNYTTSPSKVEPSDDSLVDDVGVCLHVSKHRLSLEFCSSCSDNATQSWLD